MKDISVSGSRQNRVPWRSHAALQGPINRPTHEIRAVPAQKLLRTAQPSSLGLKSDRLLAPEARHERRVQVVRLRKAGRTYDEITQITGLSKTGVFNICKRHGEHGAKALHDTPGGRKFGEDRLLSP